MERSRGGGRPFPPCPGPGLRLSRLSLLENLCSAWAEGDAVLSAQLELAQSWECCSPHPAKLRGIVAKHTYLCVSLYRLVLEILKIELPVGCQQGIPMLNTGPGG